MNAQEQLQIGTGWYQILHSSIMRVYNYIASVLFSVQNVGATWTSQNSEYLRVTYVRNK